MLSELTPTWRGICFPMAPVSIPFKRDMLSEHGLRFFTTQEGIKVSIPFKRDMLSERGYLGTR